jgi:hypothetical protein
LRQGANSGRQVLEDETRRGTFLSKPGVNSNLQPAEKSPAGSALSSIDEGFFVYHFVYHREEGNEEHEYGTFFWFCHTSASCGSTT